MKISVLFALSAALPFLLSCNVYAPLTTNSSDEDRLEEAQKCLHEADYACAIRNYEQLSNPAQKSERLCMTYLSQSGFTLTALLNVVNSGGQTMLGKLAETMIPFSQAKLDAAVSARTACVEYAASPLNQDLGALLRTMAYLGDCAIRVARTDVGLATSDSDTACNSAAGNGDGKIIKGDVSPVGGAISDSSPGMCKPDVDACRDDLANISASALTTAGFGDIKSAYDQLPAALKDSSTATALVRNALRDTVAD